MTGITQVFAPLGARVRLFALVVGMSFVAAPGVFAQDGVTDEVAPEIENRSDALDVPFVPSTTAVLDAMFEFTKPTRGDYVIDLGSGDGRIVIYAAKQFGARGHGMDLNEGLVAVANNRAKRAGVGDRARFYVRDLFKEDVSGASLVTMYLLPEVVLQLRPKLFRELKPGTRIASHDYHMGNWRFDAAKVVDGATRGEESIVYYWKVPARVAGTWKWTVSYPAYFEGAREYTGLVRQQYQDIEGRVEHDLQPMRIHDAKMDGAKIAFSITGEMDERIVRHDYAGTVDGNRITGTVTMSGGVQPSSFPWQARRTQADN